MIRTLFKLGLLVVIGLVGYNYFFGTDVEREQSREIVGKVGDLGKDAWNLLRGERQKLREGKYDDALDELDGLYGKLRDRAEELRDSELIDDLQRLNERRRELEDQIAAEAQQPSAEAKRKLDELTADTEELMHEMEEKSQPGAPY